MTLSASNRKRAVAASLRLITSTKTWKPGGSLENENLPDAHTGRLAPAGVSQLQLQQLRTKLQMISYAKLPGKEYCLSFALQVADTKLRPNTFSTNSSMAALKVSLLVVAAAFSHADATS